MNIGDRVKIIEWGAQYSMAKNMFKKLKMKNPEKNRRSYPKFLNEPPLGTILNKGKMKNSGYTVYSIRLDENNEEHLIGERGLEIVKRKLYELY